MNPLTVQEIYDNMRLPVFSSRLSMNLFALFGLIVGGAAYLFANRVQLSPDVFLPLLWIDRTIPFLPATGWIYAGQYLFLAWAFLSFDNLARGSRFIYACVFIQTLAVGIFFIFPISYPRELFAIPPETYSLMLRTRKFCPRKTRKARKSD